MPKFNKKTLIPALMTLCGLLASTNVPAQNKIYKIGTDATFPPFEYMENGKPAGFDVDLATKIFEKSNDKVEFIDTRFANLIPGLKAKKFDLLLSGLYITKERVEIVNMVPYYKTTESVIVAKNAPFQPKLREELCGKTVASINGSKFLDQLAKISTETCIPAGKPAINARAFTTSAEGVQAVLSKAVDAHYDDTSVAEALVEKLNGRVTISSTDTFFPILGGIAIRKEDKEIYDKVVKGLSEIKASGEYDQLIAKYRLQAPTSEDIEKYMPK